MKKKKNMKEEVFLKVQKVYNQGDMIVVGVKKNE